MFAAVTWVVPLYIALITHNPNTSLKSSLAIQWPLDTWCDLKMKQQKYSLSVWDVDLIEILEDFPYASFIVYLEFVHKTPKWENSPKHNISKIKFLHLVAGDL